MNLYCVKDTALMAAFTPEGAQELTTQAFPDMASPAAAARASPDLPATVAEMQVADLQAMVAQAISDALDARLPAPPDPYAPRELFRGEVVFVVGDDGQRRAITAGDLADALGPGVVATRAADDQGNQHWYQVAPIPAEETP